MRIEFDSAKDAKKRKKHGASLALADELDWDAALVWVDERFAYDEVRMVALAPKTEILYYVAFVDRGDARRILQPASCQPSRGDALCPDSLSDPPS